eukprot:sb/3466818/
MSELIEPIEDFDSADVVSTAPSIPRYSFNFVKIIVGGDVFKTQKETLERYPETLLGSSAKEKYWVEDRDAYVFAERCRRSFESILYFYQSNGILSQPKNIYGESFFDELNFFKDSSPQGASSWTYYYNNAEVKIAYPPRNFRYTRLYTTLFGGRNWFYKTDEEGNEGKYIPDVISSGIEITCIIWIIIHYVSGMLVAEQRIKYMTSFMPLVDACIVMAFIIDCLIHFVSKDPPDWVTITTVGYGDMVPISIMGKIVGSILALIGLPLIAIPMPLIMTKFESLYSAVKVPMPLIMTKFESLYSAVICQGTYYLYRDRRVCYQ